MLEQFLKPLRLGPAEAAHRLGISLNRLNEIGIGKRSITTETALRLARLLKTLPQFQMRLPADGICAERPSARRGRRGEAVG